MNDTQSLIGKILYEPQERDAIHIAVAPTRAAHDLLPGQHVNAKGEALSPLVGIVDPFLGRTTVHEGQTFWLFLYPNTITNLRHDWVHPAFAPRSKGEDMGTSEIWLRAKAAEWGMSYSYLIDGLKEGSVCFGTDDGPDQASGQETVLRAHAQAVLGMDVPEPYFRCAC